jgi:hypothetical protein
VAETTGQVATGGLAQAGASVFGWDTLLGAAVGAVLVFLFTEVREARQRSRQRSGLARLLNAEIGRNSFALRGYDPSKIALPDVVSPRTPTKIREVINIQEFPPVKLEAWQEARTLIAPLLTRKAFDTLEVYYRELEELLDMKPPLQDEREIGRVRTEAANRIHNLEGLQVHASESLKKYIDPPLHEKWFGI